MSQPGFPVAAMLLAGTSLHMPRNTSRSRACCDAEGAYRNEHFDRGVRLRRLFREISEHAARQPPVARRKLPPCAQSARVGPALGRAGGGSVPGRVPRMRGRRRMCVLPPREAHRQASWVMGGNNFRLAGSMLRRAEEQPAEAAALRQRSCAPAAQLPAEPACCRGGASRAKPPRSFR